MTVSKRSALLAAALLALGLLSGFPSYAADDLETGIQEVAKQLSSAMVGGKVKKVAIVEFPDLNGYQSALGQFIAEELITQLSIGANAGQFDVVERRQLTRVLQEQELTDSSLFDAQSISKIGKILGIEAIITGSIADLGTDVKINARVISIETAKVFGAASAKVPKNDTVVGLMRQSAGLAAQSGIASITGGARASSRPLQRAGIFFENNFLRIDVTSLTVSTEKKKAILSLMLHNIAPHDIFLAVEEAAVGGWAVCKATLIDNVDAVVSVDSNSMAGLKCIRRREDNKEDYTRFEPGRKLPLVLTFVAGSNSNGFTGNLFTLSIEMLDLFENQPRRFTVGISDIELLK